MKPVRILGVACAIVIAVAAWGSSAHAAADTVLIQASGITFTPNTVTVNGGDVIHWEAVSGNHTVTSGTGAADPNVGAHFDDPLTMGSHFYWTAPSSSQTITYPFFCRPHEGSGMKGEIVVQADPQAVPFLSATGIFVLIGLLLAVGLATFYIRRRPTPAVAVATE